MRILILLYVYATTMIQKFKQRLHIVQTKQCSWIVCNLFLDEKEITKIKMK